MIAHYFTVDSVLLHIVFVVNKKKERRKKKLLLRNFQLGRSVTFKFTSFLKKNECSFVSGLITKLNQNSQGLINSKGFPWPATYNRLTFPILSYSISQFAQEDSLLIKIFISPYRFTNGTTDNLSRQHFSIQHA